MPIKAHLRRDWKQAGREGKGEGGMQFNVLFPLIDISMGIPTSLIIISIIQVLYEFDLTINLEECYEKFEEAWMLWKNAILEYSAASINKPKQLQRALRDFDSGDSGRVSIEPYFFITEGSKTIVSLLL